MNPTCRLSTTLKFIESKQRGKLIIANKKKYENIYRKGTGDLHYDEVESDSSRDARNDNFEDFSWGLERNH